MATKPKAVFFDRDDTLIKDTGYMYKIEDLKFLPDTFELLKDLQQSGYLLFIVTNQSGIGRGYFTVNDMHTFHQELTSQLKEEGIAIQEIAFCPHAPSEGCPCRKPSPKLILDLCEKYNIDKSQSYMVGDKESDLLAGKNAGITSVHIKKVRDTF